MKRSAIVLLALLSLLLAGAALAGPPLTGSYKSVDIGGPLYVGRYTEGWDAGGSALGVGTTLNCASWDPTMLLGTQWRYYCGVQVSPAVLMINTVDANGNGNRTYMCTFVGGYIWLAGNGPWANGDPDYPGVIDSYAEFETITYSNWVPISAVTNTQGSAHFNNYPAHCLSFFIGNGTRVSTTDLGQPLPINYPGYLDLNCGMTRTLGAGWDFNSITLTIANCQVGTEESTWGSIKSLFAK
jgi:hypothetical protein